MVCLDVIMSAKTLPPRKVIFWVLCVRSRACVVLKPAFDKSFRPNELQTSLRSQSLQNDFGQKMTKVNYLHSMKNVA